MTAHLYTGHCRFSPPLNASGGRTRRDGGSTEWWMILDCDPELGRYLRWLHHVDTHRVQRLSDPLWGPHISVVQDERPTRQALWKDREGAPMRFRLLYPPQTFAEYVFFAVECDEALDYREALGLPRQPRWPLHLTFGNRKPAR